MARLMLGLLVVAVATSWLSPAVAYSPLQLPAFTLSSLKAPNAATLQSVGDAVSSLGMFAVTGFDAPNVAHDALSTFVSCALRGDIDLRQVTMDDGAKRNTIAAATNASVPQPLPADAVQHCPDFAVAANQLRAVVAATGSAYAALLDKLLYGDAACATPAQCFTDAVRYAESLEHFHLFEPAAAPTAEHTLAMHSDIGLFLVMSPAELFERVAAAAAASASPSSPRRYSHDLVVQLPDGRVVEPVLPDGALLVMNGEGLTRWMRPPSSDRPQPYSPMHEVLSSDMGGGVRAWFGRMFMPPHAARLQVLDGSRDALASSSRRMTFAEYRQHTYELFHEERGHEVSTVGCSPTRRVLVDESSCGADQVYCWMSCMNMTKLQPGDASCNKSEVVCADPYTSLVWPQNFIPANSTSPTHCKNCTIMCPNTYASTLIAISGAAVPQPSPAPVASPPPPKPVSPPPPKSAPPPPSGSSAASNVLGAASVCLRMGLQFAIASLLLRAMTWV
ncbi:hypothetical protein Agub_g5654 [Astrephomene gubernaculifera]|uniref:Fe2OG dioxygenase domain-containing protein n=1 Tax=Astrephomene gubernaculifera TaxID=47775 RepID=A0AAD3HL80_9CHLO|nr:hypothetical protein Agub_g5654 [Astrephomene gubernaculifera]